MTHPVRPALAMVALGAALVHWGCGAGLPRSAVAATTEIRVAEQPSPVDPPAAPQGPLPPPSPSRPGLAEAILAVPDGGTDPWDARIGPLLLGAFDRDGSGVIDSPAEVDKISCPVWVALDRSMTGGGRYHDIRPIYGFEVGYGWVGGAIGFDESVRAEADAAMAACGLPP